MAPKVSSRKLSFQELQRLSAKKTEVYGFATWLASALFFIIYLIWAYVPDTILEAYGVTYYPSKKWAVAIPAMIVATYVFSLVAYMSLNWISTPPSDSYATLYDVYSMEYTVDARDIDANRTATPPIADLSILDLNSRIFH